VVPSLEPISLPAIYLTSGVIETSSEVFQVGVPSKSTLPFPLPGSASKYYSEPPRFLF